MNKIIIILIYTAFLFSDFKPTSNIYDPSIGSYKQSSSQAFYFFEYIENIEIGDVIKCYCNEQLVGSRVWSGPYTDVVAMGNNGVSEYTQNYCSIGQTPTFIVQKKHSEKNLLFGYSAADEVRKHLITLWNTYSFFSNYAAADNITFEEIHNAPKLADSPFMDRWIISTLH